MWLEKDQALHKDYKFDDFVQAMAWMNMIAIEAERIQHHPEWKNVYNTVQVRLTTHDAGNTVTDLDRELSRLMDARYKQIKPRDTE